MGSQQQINSDIEEIKELSGLKRLSKNYGSTEYDEVAYSRIAWTPATRDVSGPIHMTLEEKSELTLFWSWKMPGIQ